VQQKGGRQLIKCLNTLSFIEKSRDRGELNKEKGDCPSINKAFK
jgi:hypothetical protein